VNGPTGPPPFVLREQGEADDVRVLPPEGELDLASVELLNAAVERACAERATSVTLDLRGLSFIDSTGLAAIVLAARVCETSGADFTLIPGSQSTQRLFEITGLLDALPFRGAEELERD
jgi:anti-sigma B factor antagonist